MAPIRPIPIEDTVRGQYGPGGAGKEVAAGYREEERVDPHSVTETFVALKLEIENWRWAGVPFYIRAGKCLPNTVTEVVVKLCQPPAIFSETPPPSNYYRFRVTPDLQIAIGAFVKVAGVEGKGEEQELLIDHPEDPNEMGAYEELLDDAMKGNSIHFARQDYVEESWRIVDSVLDNATPLHEYEQGTWGPPEADCIAPPDGWYNPKVA